MTLSYIQRTTIEKIKAMEAHFGVRWFVQAEFTGVTMRTMAALVERKYLEEKTYDRMSYYRFIGDKTPIENKEIK